MDVGTGAITGFNSQIRGRGFEASLLRRHRVVADWKQGELEITAITGDSYALIMGVEFYQGDGCIGNHRPCGVGYGADDVGCGQLGKRSSGTEN